VSGGSGRLFEREGIGGLSGPPGIGKGAARALQLGYTRDWMVIFQYDDEHHQ